MSRPIPDRMAYWADHYYDGRECDLLCGECPEAYDCLYADITECGNDCDCADCRLHHVCSDPRRYEEEDEA